VLAGEEWSRLIEVSNRVYEVWWTPELDAAAAPAGGTGVAVDVTDTILAQRNAEQAEAAAVALAQLRSDFVATVSHELRTPLTAVIGYAELLQARWSQLSDLERLERLERIVLAANRQKRLVEDLLLLSRLDNDLAPPQMANIQIADLIQRVTDETTAMYPGQRVELAGGPALARMPIRFEPCRSWQI